MPRPLEIFSPRPYFPLSIAKPNPNPSSHPFLPTKCVLSGCSFSHFISRKQTPHCNQKKLPFSVVASAKPSPNREGCPNSPPKKKRSLRKPKDLQESGSADISSEIFPSTIPRKPRRRGRRSEAVEVEDFVRDSLERTFSSIRKQNSEVLEGKEEILKEKNADESDGEEGLHGDGETEKVVEEEDPDWPVDAEVGWGVRASDYFDKHPIKNVVVDGLAIDWEREMDEGWVKEINCLEWEYFAFHPSPLIVLVFERYNRAADNWKLLQELEKATKVYWNAKDRLPPRTVKIDMNIEKDLTYALKVQECPQLLFLKGNRVLYREKEIRTADELVHMIAHFYYNAKKPAWIDDAAVASPY